MAKAGPAHRKAKATHIDPQTWLGLAFGMAVGVLLTEANHPGVRAAGITLLVMLLPLTVAVLATAMTRGFGPKNALIVTLFFFWLALLRLSYFI